jgi:hypothetical protein
VLRLGATIDIQVPDFEQCARAVINERPYVCNRCGYEFRRDFTPRTEIEGCPLCRQTHAKIAEEAIHRLYGGQDYEGNWHYNAFTKETLRYVLEKNGFGSIVELEKNQNGETFRQNWNVKLRATKIENMWGNDD